MKTIVELMRTRSLLLLFLMTTGLLAELTWAAASEPSEGDEDRERFLSLEADVEFTTVSTQGARESELTFDEVLVSLEKGIWQLEAGFKYEAGPDGGLIVEEGALRMAGNSERAWSAVIGRTVLPFAEFDSSFPSDPAITTAGETDDETIIVGYSTASMELIVGVFSDDQDGDEFELAGSFTAQVIEDVSVTVFGTSDIAEAVELREIRDEVSTSGMDGVTSNHGLLDSSMRHPGMGGVVDVFGERWRLGLGLVASTQEIPRGWLAPERMQPLAWTTEFTYQLWPEVSSAFRVEGSRDLPGSPETQFGFALSSELSANLSVAAELLRGELGRGLGSRSTFGVAVGLSF